MIDANNAAASASKEPKQPPTKSQLLANFVRRECAIMSLDNPEAARKRSSYRLAARLPIGQSSTAWGELVKDFPEDIAADANAPQPNLYETSAYIALMLFAGPRNHEPKTNLGAAVRQASSSVIRDRLTRVEDSYGEEELVHNLMSLLNALGAKKVKTDYGTLACDIFQLLWSDETHIRIMQKWERNYARTKTTN